MDWRNVTSQWIRVPSGNAQGVGGDLGCLEKYNDLSMKDPEVCEILEGSLRVDRTFSRIEFQEKP
jgi:hypothetical protein